MQKSILGFLLIAAAFATTAKAQDVFSHSAADAAGIQATVDSYRAVLGAQNPNVVGSFGSGRREINWDGVPDAFSAPNDLPGDFFNVNSPRGAVFSTPGTAVQVSADDDNPTSTPPRFANINPTYDDIFQVFSPQRLFSPIDSNIVDLFFFVPGTDTPALTRGFGAVYTDVDDVLNTSFEYFDAQGQSLGEFSTPVSDEGLSFLGVSFADPVVRHVRIHYGNAPLGPDDGVEFDVAVMDDFIYGEPVAVPEPASLVLALASLLCLAVCRRR
jgi:hypothetical protein